jgi:hypothetical protein
MGEGTLRPWFQPAALEALVDDLRTAQFGVDVRHYQRVQDVALVAAASGLADESAERLRTLFAPIVCQSPYEQEEFLHLFDRWVARIGSGAVTPTAAPPLKAVLDRAERGSRYWIWGIGAVASTFLGVAGWGYATRQPPTSASGPVDAGIDGAAVTVLTWLPWVAIVALTAVAGVLLWFLVWRWYGRQFLRRETTTDRPKMDMLRVRATLFGSNDDRDVAKIAAALRVRVPSAKTDLAVVESVDRTLRAGGLRALVLRNRRVLPEYLAIIERLSPADHQAALVDEMLDQLTARGVFITRYYFRGDPRLCLPARSTDEPLSLRQLAQRFPSMRLMMFSGIEALTDPASGRVSPAMADLTAWPQRALFVTGPERQEVLEAEFAQYIAVLPASASGLMAWSASLLTNGRIQLRPDHESVAVPEILRDEPDRWRTRLAPEPALEDSLLTALSLHLSPAEFMWLSACAVYPAMSWNLTATLRQALETSDALPAARLSPVALAQLPWFRYGYMPDWLRARLVDRLPRRAEHATRRALDSLLLSSLTGATADFALEIARGSSRALGRFGRAVRSVLGHDPEGPEELRDYVYARFMAGRKVRSLAVRLPEAVRRALRPSEPRSDNLRLSAARATLPKWQRFIAGLVFVAPPLGLPLLAHRNLYMRYAAVQALLLLVATYFLSFILALVIEEIWDSDLFVGLLAAIPEGVTLALLVLFVTRPATFASIVYGGLVGFAIIQSLRGRVVRLPLCGRLASHILGADAAAEDGALREAAETARLARTLSLTGPFGWIAKLRRDPIAAGIVVAGTAVFWIAAVIFAALGDGVDGYDDDWAEGVAAVATLIGWQWPWAVSRLRHAVFGIERKLPPALVAVLVAGPLGWLVALRSSMGAYLTVALLSVPLFLIVLSVPFGLVYPWSAAVPGLLLCVAWYWPLTVGPFRQRLLHWHPRGLRALAHVAAGPFAALARLRGEPLEALRRIAWSAGFFWVAGECLSRGDGIDGYDDDLWEVLAATFTLMAWFPPVSSQLPLKQRFKVRLSGRDGDEQ